MKRKKNITFGDFDRTIIVLLMIAAIGCIFWSCFLTILLEQRQQQQDEALTTLTTYSKSLMIKNVEDQQQQQATTTTPLVEFFEKLCHYNISDGSCCGNISSINILDDLSMTLGNSMNNNNIPSSNKNDNPTTFLKFASKPPIYRDVPLNCSSFPNTFRVITHPKYRVKNKKPFTKVFSGNILYNKPRTMIDLIMISYEIDVLEARLYEYNHIMDYFIIFESNYNHRGWKKKQFLKEIFLKDENRLKPFQDKIIFIDDITKCPMYKNAIHNERGSNNGTIKSAGKTTFEIENALRTCRWPLIKDMIQQKQWSNDTLVLISDLDWFPDTNLMKHIKYCEPSKEYGYYNPFHLTLKYNLYSSLKLGCQSASCSDICFALHSIQRIRELDGLPERGKGFIDQTLDRSNMNHNSTIPFFCSGVHFQSVTSYPGLLYREVTHVESKSIRSDLLLDKNHTSYCNITSNFLNMKQKQWKEHPETMSWKIMNHYRNPNTKSQSSHVDKDGQLVTTNEHLDSLRQCQIPYIMIENPQAYPDAWGI